MQKDREYRERRRARTRDAAHEEDVNQRRTESLAQRLSQWWRLRQGDGLSRSAYAAMLAGQGGVCATCRRPMPIRSLSIESRHRRGARPAVPKVQSRTSLVPRRSCLAAAGHRLSEEWPARR